MQNVEQIIAEQRTEIAQMSPEDRLYGLIHAYQSIGSYIGLIEGSLRRDHAGRDQAELEIALYNNYLQEIIMEPGFLEELNAHKADMQRRGWR